MGGLCLLVKVMQDRLCPRRRRWVCHPSNLGFVEGKMPSVTQGTQEVGRSTPPYSTIHHTTHQIPHATSKLDILPLSLTRMSGRWWGGKWARGRSAVPTGV